MGGKVRLALIPVLLVIATGAQAQGDAEDAFRRGDYRAARAGYESMLARDSNNVRALYRLAIMDSWDGALDRSLARFARLRRLEPRDPDIMVAHARVLAWAGKQGAALALYDSALVIAPRRADALAGRARTVAWSGDLDRAERLWREALAIYPDDPEIAVGMAQTLLWRGQPALAESYAARARRLAPEDKSARDVLDLIRAALAPEIASRADYLHDSDRNGLFTHQASYSASLGAGVRGTLFGSWRRATDPLRAGGSYSAGARIAAPLGGSVVARAGLGAHIMAPDSAGPHTTIAPELGMGVRLGRATAFSAAWRRSFFDETALLLRRRLTISSLDFDLELSPAPRVSVSLGGGPAWVSGNRRIAGVGAIMIAAAPGLEIGGLARGFGYEQPNPGLGYFAPDFFGVVEGRARYGHRWGPWGVRADGGLGAQQVGKGSSKQTAWHAGLALTRAWHATNEVTLSGSLTNSAASSATGAYRSWTVGLQWRQAL